MQRCQVGRNSKLEGYYGHGNLIGIRSYKVFLGEHLYFMTSTPTNKLFTHGHLLSGYGYHLQQGPYLQVDDLTTNPTTRYCIPVWGQKLNFKPLAVRYCVGTYDIATQHYIPCPHKRQVKLQYENCYPCFAMIGFNPAFYNVPAWQLSPRQQVYNRMPHCVYLAYFGPNLIKVGIAYQKRILKRWLEQGARAAIILHIAQDAYTARSLEVQLSKILQIPERITSIQKKRLLNNPYSFKEATKVLEEYRKLANQALPIPSASYEVHNLQSHYFPTTQPQEVKDADKIGLPASGRAVGMIGDILVYANANGFLMSALKQYVGNVQVSLTLSLH